MSVTVSDDQHRCLKLIAEMNGLSVSATTHEIIAEWMRMKAIQQHVMSAIDAQLLDQAVSGVPN